MSGQNLVGPDYEVLKYVIAVALGIWVGYIWVHSRNKNVLGYVVASTIFSGIFVFLATYIPGVVVAGCALLALFGYIKDKLFR